MKSATEQSANEAPKGLWDRAWKNWRGQGARSKSTSQPNHSLMSALLDRMGRKAEGEESADQEDSDSSANLADTQPSERTLRPMTFTYPSGASPLPQYTIRRGIGIGGFGEVYFAVSDAGKEVAIKRIQRNLEVELRGASHCLNLKHPNLVSLYDICRDDTDQSWVVMEYIAGPNLRQVLDQKPRGLDPADVQRWFSGICAGISHLHSAGLVHRDIKPGNIFDDMGIVKVGDYGLSKFISASHRGGHTESVGTFHYMAPEIGRGEYGKEIDVYALGILLFELLTGDVPFDGESCHEIIVKHLTAVPDLGQIADPYRRVISKALDKDPRKRHRDVNEMLVELGWAKGNGMRPSPMPIPAAEKFVEPVARVESPLPEAVAASSIEESPVNPVVQAASTVNSNEEPLARAVRQSLVDLNRWWKSLDHAPVVKTIFVLLGSFLLLINAGFLLPMLSLVAMCYVPYYVIRQMTLHVRQQPTYAQAQRLASNSAAVARPMTRKQWHSQMRHELRAKKSISRMAELSTSWFAAALITCVMTGAAGMMGLYGQTVDAVAVTPFAWMLVVVLLGSLGILGMGKLWERDEGEALPRRLVLAGLGAGVGFVASQLGDFLMFLEVAGGSALARDIDVSPLPPSLYTDGHSIASPGAYMAHFALLFAAIRWWKPVDPLRRTRLSLWSVACIVVVAWFVHQIVPIPQPFGMLMAGGIAIATQLSATWIDRRRSPKVPVINTNATEGGHIV